MALKARGGSWLIPAGFAVLIVALVALAVHAVLAAERKNEHNDAVRAAGGQTPPPWLLPTNAPARVRAAGLSLGPMGTADHYHAHLDVVVDGATVFVPANIGIDPASGQMAAVHTHTADGIVHVEAATRNDTFTLGQLFAEWNVQLTRTQVGSLKAGHGKKLAAFVNGKQFGGDPADIVFKDKRQIALVYGGPDQIKPPKPFAFPENL